MKKNLVDQTLLDHKSIRKFSDKTVSDKAVTTIVQAGQQAPFASQYYSVLLSRNIKRNPMNAPPTLHHLYRLLQVRLQGEVLISVAAFSAVHPSRLTRLPKSIICHSECFLSCSW